MVCAQLLAYEINTSTSKNVLMNSALEKPLAQIFSQLPSLVVKILFRWFEWQNLKSDLS